MKGGKDKKIAMKGGFVMSSGLQENRLWTLGLNVNRLSSAL